MAHEKSIPAFVCVIYSADRHRIAVISYQVVRMHAAKGKVNGKRITFGTFVYGR